MGGLFSTGIYPVGLYPSGLYSSSEDVGSEPEIIYPLTVEFREPIYNIVLSQGDTRDVGVVLLGAKIGVNLTFATVTFVLKHLSGTPRYEIKCKKGNTYQGNYISPVNGGITLPLSPQNDSISGTFAGTFRATSSHGTKTYPNDSYIEVRIIKAL